MHGSPKYGSGFGNFDYVKVDAPKGGIVRRSILGVFDTLNPFSAIGTPAGGLHYLFESLLVSPQDEPLTGYGLIAEQIEVPQDRSSAIFTLRKEARWQDSKPITVEDVIWSFETLKKIGNTRFKRYYSEIETVNKIGIRKVKFTFRTNKNRELPLIVGKFPILPKHYWKTREFNARTLEPPLGSGPYKILNYKVNKFISYKRDISYWGSDLPVNIGRYNPDIISFKYHRNEKLALASFRSGDTDFRIENNSRAWAKDYTSKSLLEGLYKKLEIKHNIPTGMQAFVFNTRKKIFKNPIVRKALSFAFDFEWTNKNLFYNQYVRTKSFFSNSELASTGSPSPEEMLILQPFRKQLPPELFNQAFNPPTTDGSGRMRKHLRKARKLLKKAGWFIEDGILLNEKTRTPFAFNILLISPAFKRIVMPFARNLKLLGIQANIEVANASDYLKLTHNLDFDMIISTFTQSLSPGTEQRDYWGSSSAKNRGTLNLAGIQNPIVDHIINLILQSKNRRELIIRTRALDRVLLWGNYVIPQWHINYFRIALWDKFGYPKPLPKYGLAFDSWWVDKDKEYKLRTRNISND
ncbi:MAG: extracellular solute-binding protein [Pseudomonadota bacterium]|nr:extracellular solute-binding protein [Pseudomonadota bacterium]